MEQTTSNPIRHRREENDKSQDRFFKLRNILNIIFMIGAVVGLVFFFFSDKTIGTVIILASMVFKMAECCFRFIR